MEPARGRAPSQCPQAVLFRPGPAACGLSGFPLPGASVPCLLWGLDASTCEWTWLSPQPGKQSLTGLWANTPGQACPICGGRAVLCPSESAPWRPGSCKGNWLAVDRKARWVLVDVAPGLWQSPRGEETLLGQVPGAVLKEGGKASEQVCGNLATLCPLLAVLAGLSDEQRQHCPHWGQGGSWMWTRKCDLSLWMEYLQSENLSCPGAAALNYNLRSNLLELISPGNKMTGFWQRDCVLCLCSQGRLPSENIWGQGDRDFLTWVQMVLSSGKIHTCFHCVWSICPLLEFARKSLHFSGKWTNLGKRVLCFPERVLILRWKALLCLALLGWSVYSPRLIAVDPGSMSFEQSDMLISTHSLWPFVLIRIFILGGEWEQMKWLPSEYFNWKQFPTEKNQGLTELTNSPDTRGSLSRGEVWCELFLWGQLDGGAPLWCGTRSLEGSLNLELFPILKNKWGKSVWFWGDLQIFKFQPGGSPRHGPLGGHGSSPKRLSFWVPWRRGRRGLVIGLSTKGEFKDSGKMSLEVNLSFFLFRKCLQLPLLPQPLSPTLYYLLNNNHRPDSELRTS